MGYTDMQGKRATAMKPSGDRYNRTAEQKQALDKAFSGYVPGGYGFSAQTPQRKKKKAAKKKRVMGQGYSRNADQVYKNAKAGKYD